MRARARRLRVMSMVVLVAGLVATPASAVSPRTVTTGLSGTVTAADTGAPLRADVFAYPQTGFRGGHGKSGDDGHYTSRALPSTGPGDYVCFRQDPYWTAPGRPFGYAPQCYGGAEWDGLPAPPTGTTVPIPSGTIVPGIDAALMPGGAIRGKVTLAGASSGLGGVFVFDSAGYEVASTTYNLSFLNGTYELDRLSPGDYRVCYSASYPTPAPPHGYQSECLGGTLWDGQMYTEPPAGSTVVTVNAGAATTAGIELPVAAGISGNILDSATGAGISGAFYRIFDADGHVVDASNTLYSGRFSSPALPPGEYRVCVAGQYVTYDDPRFPSTPGGFVNECFGRARWVWPDPPPATARPVQVSDASDTSVTFRLADGAGLTGQLSGTASAYVEAYSRAGTLLVREGVRSPYEITGLPAFGGGVVLCIRNGYDSPGFAPQCAGGVDWNGAGPPPASAAATPVTAGAMVSGPDVVVRPGGAITGVVSSSGRRVDGVRVRVFDAAGDEFDPTRVYQTGFPLHRGVFRVDGLAPGVAYRVCFDTAQVTTGDFADQCHASLAWDGVAADVPAAARPIVLQPGEIRAKVNATLRPA